MTNLKGAVQKLCVHKFIILNGNATRIAQNQKQRSCVAHSLRCACLGTTAAHREKSQVFQMQHTAGRVTRIGQSSPQDLLQ